MHDLRLDYNLAKSTFISFKSQKLIWYCCCDSFETMMFMFLFLGTFLFRYGTFRRTI
jgi:hypothetical protein